MRANRLRPPFLRIRITPGDLAFEFRPAVKRLLTTKRNQQREGCRELHNTSENSSTPHDGIFSWFDREPGNNAHFIAPTDEVAMFYQAQTSVKQGGALPGKSIYTM